MKRVPKMEGCSLLITEMLRHVERGADGEGKMNGLNKMFALPNFPERDGVEGRTPALHDDHAEELTGAEAEFLGREAKPMPRTLDA